MWRPKGLSDKTIKPPTTSDNSLTPLIYFPGYKVRLKSNGVYLKQPKISYTHGTIVNIYIVYELGASGSNDNHPTLKTCLFGAVTLTKKADVDKYRYSGYGIGFGRRSRSSISRWWIWSKYINWSRHEFFCSYDNKKKNILVLGKGPTQGLEHTSAAEKTYSINFTVTKKKFCLSLHYNGANSYLFVNGIEIYELKAKESKIVATSLCLGNISKDWSLYNMKKNWFTGYTCDFSVDYDAIAVDHIKNIHKCLMKKNNIK